MVIWPLALDTTTAAAAASAAAVSPHLRASLRRPESSPRPDHYYMDYLTTLYAFILLPGSRDHLRGEKLVVDRCTLLLFRNSTVSKAEEFLGARAPLSERTGHSRAVGGHATATIDAAGKRSAEPLAACTGRRAPPPRPTPPGNEAQRR